jgi:ATP/ADP translocase
VLQFCIIPLIIPHLDLLRLWPIMPLIMLVLLLCMSFEGGNHSLGMVAASFCTLKVLEYSLRGVANELLFASLDYESRYVAKQEIALLANRFAKSFTAVALSLVTEYVSSAVQVHAILSWTASVLATAWLFFAYQLGQMGGTKTKEKKL